MKLSSSHLSRSFEDFYKDAIKSSILSGTAYTAHKMKKSLMENFIFVQLYGVV